MPVVSAVAHRTQPRNTKHCVIEPMTARWTPWKPFPKTYNKDKIDAPSSPGVYEVWHTATGEPVALGCSENVARTLARIASPSLLRRLVLLLEFWTPHYDTNQYEYRYCTAANMDEAKVKLEQLLGHRQAMLRRFSPALRQ